MKKFFFIVLMISLVAGNCFSQKDRTIDLKFNLPNGSGYVYNADVNMIMKMNNSGQEINLTNNMAMGYNFKVVDDSAGWKKVSTEFSHIGMKMNTAGVSIDYDSEKPVDTTNVMNTTIGKVFGAMKGSTFVFTINKNGEIGYVSGVDEMKEKMLASVAAGDQMANGVSNSFSEESFKQNMQQSFGFYPGKPVKVGDTWAKTMNANNNGVQIKMDNTYTLESVKDNVASVKVNSKLSSESSVPLTGTLTGDMQYDIPTGILINGNLDMLMKIDVNAGGQSSTMNMDIKTILTGKKI